MNYLYVGAFIDWDDLNLALSGIKRSSLARKIQYPHVTFAYMPDTVDEGLFGEPVDLEITGYGADAENEGVSVRIMSCCDELEKAAAKIAKPHITLSVSEQGQPVNTKRLEFAPVNSVTIRGIYGGFEIGKGPVLTKRDKE